MRLINVRVEDGEEAGNIKWVGIGPKEAGAIGKM